MMFFPQTHKPRDKWKIAHDLRILAIQAENTRQYAAADRLYDLARRASEQAALTEWPLARR